MAKVNFDKKYMCIGENFKGDIPIGYCGDVMPLIDFLMICYPSYTEEYVKGYFEGSSEKSVLEYILINGGKRLVKGE